jgi:hypothetical protein
MKKLLGVSVMLAWAGFACAGVDGSDGKDGTPGTPGSAGTQGAAGEAGSAGSGGSDGANGDPGTPYDGGPSVPESCKAIKTANAGATDGVYAIRSAGLDLDVTCNMTDGGWTMIESLRAGQRAVISYAIIPGTPLGRYMPEKAVAALATVSSQVRFVRSATPTDYVESIADTLPIVNLRKLIPLNDDATMGTNSANWTAFGTLLVGSMDYACATTTMIAYPDLYWACGNPTGVHIQTMTNATSRLVFNEGNIDVDVYVK